MFHSASVVYMKLEVDWENHSTCSVVRLFIVKLLKTSREKRVKSCTVPSTFFRQRSISEWNSKPPKCTSNVTILTIKHLYFMRISSTSVSVKGSCSSASNTNESSATCRRNILLAQSFTVQRVSLSPRLSFTSAMPKWLRRLVLVVRHNESDFVFRITVS